MIRKLNIKIKPFNPVEFISRFASELDLEPKIQTESIKLIGKMQKAEATSGKNPCSLAATAIYIAALLNKTKITQKKISEISGITETTLRNRTKEMIGELGIKKSDLKKKKA